LTGRWLLNDWWLDNRGRLGNCGLLAGTAASNMAAAISDRNFIHRSLSALTPHVRRRYRPLYGVTFMMIDDDTLKQLLRINDEVLQLCKWLNENRDIETSSALYLSWTNSLT
jgi:hypothetical protein